MKLTKIPIVIYYGDNISKQPSANPGQEGNYGTGAWKIGGIKGSKAMTQAYEMGKKV